MDELIIETSHKPEVTIEAQGKLYIKGWDRAEVRASASGKDNLSLKKEGESVNIQSLSNCEMRVPYETRLLIQSARRETILKSVTGHITIQQAGASLTLNDVGVTRIEYVDRDINVREVHGDLTIQRAGGFVHASHIAGNFTAESIGAHLTLKQIEGNVTALAHGNVTLILDPKPKKTYTVEAHGVLTCQIPSDANVTVEINGQGPIVTKIGSETQTIRDNTHSLTLGDGSARLELTGYGPVSLLENGKDFSTEDYHFETDMDLEMDTLAQNITQQVNEQISMQMNMLEAQMDALVDTYGISEEKAERIRKRTEEKVARAQEKIARAQEKAAQKIEMARRKAEKSGRYHDYGIHTGLDEARAGIREGLAAAKSAVSFALGSTRKSPPSDPVSDEERMMILNMLAEKKISIEQAEALLSALEGKSQ
ncbi:MAG TPA: hypothetical protein VI451_18380 [Anaerolineales bacterium]|nr:hypothetical protein [Anaerolineales bacterium]